MFNILKAIRPQKIERPFDIEKAVGHYLLTLPRCTSRVLVVSRRYLDKRYNYELTLDTISLAEWSVKHDKGAWSSHGPMQAVRKALPLWLIGADLADDAVTFPPKEFFSLLREYHETFMSMKNSEAYCHECRHVIDYVLKKRMDLPPKEIFDCWRIEWHCPQGHLLYKEEFGAHFDAR